MPTWAKVLLAIVALLVFVVVGAVGAGYYWWSHNKDALLAKGRAVFEAGQAAGRATDNQGCVDQSLARYKNDRGFTGGISTGIFMRSCLDTSRPTPGFCDDVPKPLEFLKAAEWRVSRCRQAGLSSDQFCDQIFQGVESFCSQRTR